MFKKILYPTDFSDVSKKVLPYLKQLKEGGSKEVLVVHVIDERGITAIEQYTPIASGEIERNLKEESEQELTAIAEELKQSGLEAKTRIETGVPLREILRIAEEEDVSLIVLGSHGRSNIEEMLLGSVSEKVVRKCKKPVLVVKR